MTTIYNSRNRTGNNFKNTSSNKYNLDNTVNYLGLFIKIIIYLLILVMEFLQSINI